MVNNTNIRKLAEQEHFHNLGTAGDPSPKLTEEKPTTTTTATMPPTPTITTTHSPATRRTISEGELAWTLNRPWYMEGGGRRPGNASEGLTMSLFPEDIPNSDRIPGDEDEINISTLLTGFLTYFELRKHLSKPILICRSYKVVFGFLPFFIFKKIKLRENKKCLLLSPI